jgi:Zinc finger, C2H2 type
LPSAKKKVARGSGNQLFRRLLTKIAKEMASVALQDIKREPGHEEGLPSIGAIDLGPFLLGNEVKIEPKTVRKKRKTAVKSGGFSEAEEAKYRDPNVETNKFGCRFCPIVYQNKRQVVGHVRKKHQAVSKTGETIYEKCYQRMNDLMARCKLCDNKQNLSYPDFKRHVYKAHETTKTCMECQACGAFFASSQTLQKHEATKHQANGQLNTSRVKCEFCSLDFAEVRNLKHHQFSKHKSLVKDADAQPTRGLQKECEICGKVVRNANSLWSHKRIAHHTELSGSENGIARNEDLILLFLPDLKKPKPTFNHSCPKCDMNFKWASNLSRHRRQVHENVQYKCKWCKKSFGTRQTIYSHSFTHTKLVRYKCSEPNCRFKNMLKSKSV